MTYTMTISKNHSDNDNNEVMFMISVLPIFTTQFDTTNVID